MASSASMASSAEKGFSGLPKFSFEKGATEHENGGTSESLADMKLDKHGLPLVPQPSNHDDDPLVGSYCFHAPPFFPAPGLLR